MATFTVETPQQIVEKMLDMEKPISLVRCLDFRSTHGQFGPRATSAVIEQYLSQEGWTVKGQWDSLHKTEDCPCGACVQGWKWR